MANTNTALDDLLSDLTRDQLVSLVNYMWVAGNVCRRSAIKGWRRANGLPPTVPAKE